VAAGYSRYSHELAAVIVQGLCLDGVCCDPFLHGQLQPPQQMAFHDMQGLLSLAKQGGL
jgi:hypothetical protein